MGLDGHVLAGAHPLARRPSQIDGVRLGAAGPQHAGTGHRIGDPRDRFTDDRLTIVLRHLSDEQRWQATPQELGQQLVRVYEPRGAADPRGCNDRVRLSERGRGQPVAIRT